MTQPERPNKAELERRMRIREGMARSPARPGRRAELPADTERMILELRTEGYGHRSIAKILAERDVPTAQGGQWTHSTVAKILKRLGDPFG
jgi:recombinase